MRALMRWVVLGIAVLFLAACAEPPYTNVDNAGLQRLLGEGVPVFDVRRPGEWRETGVVAGSELLTFVDEAGRVMPGFLQDLTGRVGQHEPLVLICRTGSRTDVLARHLVERLGYTRVYNVRHGITAWIGDGLPVDRG